MQAPDSPVSWPDVVKHVGSELALRQVEVCTAPKPSRALARLRFELMADGLRIGLWVDTTPIAERTLDLGSVPSDARLLAIAVAADELLAANWADLEDRAKPKPEPARRRPEAADIPVKPMWRGELGPGFVYESFAEGQTLLGADARLRYRFLTLRAGFRQGLPQQADHGSVHTRALLAGLGVRAQLYSAGRLQLGLLSRLDALWLDATAYADPSARARDQDGWAVVAAAGPELRVALSRRVWLAIDTTAGGALRPVHLTDTGQRVSGVGGFAFGFGGGVYVSF